MWQLAPGLVCVRVVDLHGAIIKRVLANVTGPQLYPQFIVGMAAKPRRCLRYFLGAFAADVTVYPSVESWAKEHAPAGSAGAGAGVRALESRWLGPHYRLRGERCSMCEENRETCDETIWRGLFAHWRGN